MDSKYSLSYNLDEKYCYPGTNDLRNKLNIKNEKTLFFFERSTFFARQATLELHPLSGNFDLNHLKKIHEYLFQDIYEWAGKIRVVDIAKNDLFCLSIHIESFAKAIFDKLKRDNYLQGLSKEEFIYKLTELLADINALHPFREGNGRTQREFIRYVCGINGYDIDFSNVSEQENIIASHESINGDNSKLQIIIEKSLYPLDHIHKKIFQETFKKIIK